MFALNPDRAVFMPYPLIVSGYEELLYHDGPVLYSGVNAFGDYVIGLTVEEHDATRVVRSFHVVVRKSQYADFIMGRVPLLQLYRDSPPLFVVDQPYDGGPAVVYPVALSEVPEDYLPLESATCPPPLLLGSFEYATALEGSIAEEHLILPHALAGNAVNWAEVIEEPFNLLPGFSNTQAQIATMRPSSFEINYIVKCNPYQQDLFDTHKQASLKPDAFASMYLHYAVNDLSDDVILLLPGREAKSKGFNDLLAHYFEFTQSKGEEGAREELISSLRRTLARLGKVSALIGEGFDAVTLASEGGGESQFIGTINRNDATKIKQSAAVLSEAVKPAVDRVDDVPRDYRIFVTHINKDTGMCEAHVVLERGGGERAYPKAKVLLPEGLKLTQSRFSRSLHEDVEITVRGIGSWIGDDIKSIEIVD